jgi:hypothetical protein
MFLNLWIVVAPPVIPSTSTLTLAVYRTNRHWVCGKTEAFGASIVCDPVLVHDYHPTILHLLGMDYERLPCRHAGRDFRLAAVAGRVVDEIITG